ncbi:MAG: alpha-glycosidase, partial [Lachnospiraceae bacterium]|nr:alpha-glycosidase [Lachnospiraceae bacterium]
KQLIGFHREMIRIHKENFELKSGSLVKLLSENYALSYARFSRDTCVVVIINRDEAERTFTVPVWQAAPVSERLEQIILSTREGYSIDRRVHNLDGGSLVITLPPVSGVVLRTER